MSILLLAAAAVAQPPDAVPDTPPRRCSAPSRSIGQTAYRPYGGPLFGADGLVCATVRPDAGARVAARPGGAGDRSTAVLRGLAGRP